MTPTISKDAQSENFTPAQAAQYASSRSHSYPQPLYDVLLEYHTGPRDTLLDVGTGPGKVVFDLLPHFQRAVGCDASPGMIAQAQLGVEKLGLTERASFVECRGERCDDALAPDHDGQADVVTVAMAAHWFDDLPTFYAAAGRVLRPGGTLAMWTASSLYCHSATPNAHAVQAALDECHERMLAPCETEGSWMSRTAYRTLPLPFDMVGFEATFEGESFVRKQWGAHGIPSVEGNAEESAGPFLGHVEMNLEDLESGLSTSRSVMRWRKANPGRAMTEADPLKMTTETVRQLLGDRESLVMSPTFVLLMMRKSL